MLYSKFGSRLTPISKSEDASHRVIVHATVENATDVREYQVTDLKADGGAAEIEQVIAQLPVKVVERKQGPPRRPIDVPQQQNNHRNNTSHSKHTSKQGKRPPQRFQRRRK